MTGWSQLRSLALRARRAREDEQLDLPSLARVRDFWIRAVLRLCRGDKTRAARLLGIGRSTLYRRVEEMGSEPRWSRRRRRPSDFLPPTRTCPATRAVMSSFLTRT